MKQQIIKPDKDIEPMAQDKPSDDAALHSAEEIDASNIYLPAYADPFMPMMDLTFVFDELRKMVNSWFLSKREGTINKKRGA